MLLYWGLFTVGFILGAMLSFRVFAPKKPEDDLEYETKGINGLKGQLRDIRFNNRGLSREIKGYDGISSFLLTEQGLNQPHQQVIGTTD